MEADLEVWEESTLGSLGAGDQLPLLSRAGQTGPTPRRRFTQPISPFILVLRPET